MSPPIGSSPSGTPPGRRLPGAAVALAALVCAAVSMLAADPAPPGEDSEGVPVFATWETWAALGLDDGRIILVDVTDGRRTERKAPSGPILELAIVPDSSPAADPPAPARRPDLIAAVPGPGRTALLLVISGESGVILAQAALRAAPARILPGPRGRSAYLVMEEHASRDETRGSGDSSDWSLQALDLTVKDPKPVSIPAGGRVLAAAITPRGERILLAQEDRIRSFATDPLRSSWMLGSPGENLCLVPFARGEILVGRRRELAFINPEKLPGKNPASGAVAGDDAVSRLALPFEAASVSISQDGEEAAVIDPTGTRLALVDLGRWEVREVRAVPRAALALFHPARRALFVFEKDGDLVELVYSNRAEERLAGPLLASTETPPPPAIQTAAPPAREEAAPIGGGEGDGTDEAIAPETPKPDPVFLTGRITGNSELVEGVILYGPDSIVREHVRIPIGEGGVFSALLPPAGRYRVVPAAREGAQLNVKPPLRLIHVEGAGIDGLDFDVAGKLAGSIVP